MRPATAAGRSRGFRALVHGHFVVDEVAGRREWSVPRPGAPGAPSGRGLCVGPRARPVCHQRWASVTPPSTPRSEARRATQHQRVVGFAGAVRGSRRLESGHRVGTQNHRLPSAWLRRACRGAQKRSAARSFSSFAVSPALLACRVASSPTTRSDPNCQRAPVRTVRSPASPSVSPA